MRITCPNCGAHYEVADDVIPANGRDVQCSSCGNTWFQRGLLAEASSETTQEPQIDDDQSTEIETDAPENAPEDEQSDQSEAVEPTAEPPEVTGERAGLDKGVADILRSEAERETAERTQGVDLDSGLDAAITNITEDPANQGNEQINVDMSDENDMARSELLPDIEEINSTLASDNVDDPETAVDVEIKNKNGFRRGFIFAVVVFAILALIYVFARQIADAVPQTASVLSGYVDWVNALREAVDSMMLKAVDKLTGLLAQLDSGDQS